MTSQPSRMASYTGEDVYRRITVQSPDGTGVVRVVFTGLVDTEINLTALAAETLADRLLIHAANARVD